MIVYDEKFNVSIGKICSNCEFNMGSVCLGMYYGLPIEQVTKKELQECNLFGISLNSYLSIVDN